MDSDSSSTPMKRCNRCLQEFPATSEFFVIDTGIKCGLRPLCKPCRSLTRPDKKPRDILPEGMKRCFKCKAVLPATREHFETENACRDGLHPQCRECIKKKMAAYRKVNKQKIAENHKVWRDAHKDRIVEWGKQDRRIHREKRKATQKRYYQANKEQNRAKARNRRARVRQVKGTHTPAQIQEQLKRQRYRCYYQACGHAKFKRVKKHGKWKYDYHVEHTFPLKRIEGTDIPGNDMGYLVLSCPECNQKKGTMFPWEFFEGGRLL